MIFRPNDRIVVKGTGAKGVVQSVHLSAHPGLDDEVTVVLDSATMLVMNEERSCVILYAAAVQLDAGCRVCGSTRVHKHS